MVNKLINNYHNSRDNGYEMPGLLLLSYPSIESFMISCFENDMLNKRIDEIKKYVRMKRYNPNKIDETK